MLDKRLLFFLLFFIEQDMLALLLYVLCLSVSLPGAANGPVFIAYI